jgi:hypothetical protein
MPLSFFNLPGEVRNQIYSLLLTVPAINIPRVLGSDPRIYPLPLLILSRATYDEASQILYGENTFIAHPSLLSSMPRLRHYYDTISSPRLTSMIKKFHLRMRLDCDTNFTSKSAKEAFDACEEVTVEVWQAQFGSSDFEMLKVFEDVRGVGVAKITGSTSSFPEYAKWLERSMMAPAGTHVLGFVEDEEDLTGIEYEVWTVSGPFY